MITKSGAKLLDFGLAKAAAAPVASTSAGAGTLTPTERMPLTQHHSLHVVRASGRTMLIAVSPSGCALLDKWEGKDEAV